MEQAIDEAFLERLELAANAATPGPWRNICDEWNAALDDWRRRNGGRTNYHGSLRGSRHKTSNKHCATLIVRDEWQGKPIDVDAWSRQQYPLPDYFDFVRVVAEPFDQLFYFGKRRSVAEEGKLWDQGPGGARNADFIALANPETIKALVKALRDERAKSGGGA